VFYIAPKVNVLSSIKVNVG